jgi:hypothetical protein
VGHKFGGILIKSLIIEVNKVARRKNFDYIAEKEAKDSCEAFQHNLSGIMFYDVPHFMTPTDIQIMFQGDCDNYEEIKFSRSAVTSAYSSQNFYRKLGAFAAPSADPPQIIYRESQTASEADAYQPINRKVSAWQALSHQTEAINEDFEDSNAHDHTKICVISHGLTMKMKVNSLKLHHVLDDGHINILAFVQGQPYGKS